MIRKARENLKSAGTLLRAKCFNAAGSRAYYAAYHAAWWFLDQRKETPDRERQGKPYWSHDGISHRVLATSQRFDRERKEEFVNLLLANRTLADYDKEDLSEIVVRDMIETAKGMLEDLEGEIHEQR